MPIVYQQMIYREDLQNNPGILYVFGDNDMRKGMGGQAGQMRDEPNAVGVRTKWAPSNSRNAFFTDEDYDQIVEMIEEDLEQIIEALENDQIVIFPSDGIGTGLARLEETAPRVFDFLQTKLEGLKEQYGVKEL